MTFETILFSKGDDGIAWVSLNRPKVRNAINEQMQAELREVWRDIRYDGDVRCVVLTAEGDHFCTGIDRAEAVSEENNAAMAAGDYPGYPTPWMYDDPGRDDRSEGPRLLEAGDRRGAGPWPAAGRSTCSARWSSSSPPRTPPSSTRTSPTG